MRIVKEIDKERKVGVMVFEIIIVVVYWLIYNMIIWCKVGVDVMIIECGMGGVRDVINVIWVDIVFVLVFISVGLDYIVFLGEIVEEIIKEKVSIVV